VNVVVKANLARRETRFRDVGATNPIKAFVVLAAWLQAGRLQSVLI
jgi:hypothetical protein